MSRREHLTPFEGERIRALAEKGLTHEKIAHAVDRSTKSISRVLRGERGLPMWQPGHASFEASRTKQLVQQNALRLVHQIDVLEIQSEDEMPTSDQIRELFVEALTPHFVVRRAHPERFLTDLASTLRDETFSVPVLKLAARNLIRTRTQQSFPTVASCVAACLSAQGELRASTTSNSDRSPTDSDEGSEVA